MTPISRRRWLSPKALPLLGGVALGILVSLLQIAPAAAARLEWNGGVTNLELQSAKRCTLNVIFSSQEALDLYDWRLVWVAEGTGVMPMRLVTAAGIATDAAPCDVRRDRDDSRGARIDTAYFCTTRDIAAPLQHVQYVLEVNAAVPARIAILPVLQKGGVTALEVSGVAEATINGGCAPRYPPVLAKVTCTNQAQTTIYHVAGAYLDNLGEAHILQQSSQRAIPLQIVNVSSATADLKGPLLERVEAGALEVRNREGQWTAIPIDWRSSGLARSVAPQLIVEVDPQALNIPPLAGGGDGTATSLLVPGLASALTQGGVVEITPVFSTQSRDAGRSQMTNLLGETIDPVPLDNWFLGTLELDADVPKTIERVRSIAGIRAVCENQWRVMAYATPNDPLFSQQWGLYNGGGTVCGYSSGFTYDIGAVSAWDTTTGTPTVRIGVLDSGINAAHEEFGSGRVVLGPDFTPGGGLAVDTEGHGTSVAGIAGATGNNGKGMAGVAWGVQLWAGKVIAGGSTPTDLMEGLVWANDNNLPIVNMSLGWNEIDITSADHNVLADATLTLFKRGLFLVAASGNTGAGSQFNAIPADLDKRVYAVGAFLPDGERWQDIVELGASDCSSLAPCKDSNFGPWLDAMAPGGSLVTTTALGSSAYVDLSGCITGNRSTMGFNGTSAAAPVVSGVAALLLSRRPELIGEDISQILNRTTAGPNPPNTWAPDVGWGRVNARNALNFVEGANKVVAHWGAGPGPFSLGPLEVMPDSFLITSREFKGVPGMPSGDYTTSCVRYHLKATLTWPFMFASDVRGWTRSSGTRAWKDIGPYDYRVQVDTATFVPATFGPSGVTVEAYVFRVRNALDPTKTVGWFPSDPAHAQVALTVIGSAAGTTDVGPSSVAARLAITTVPNPSRGMARIVLDVPRSGHVRGVVLDLAGRRIATIVEGDLQAGRHEFSWNGAADGGSRCPAGIYFCRVDCAGIATMARFVRLSGK